MKTAILALLASLGLAASFLATRSSASVAAPTPPGPGFEINLPCNTCSNQYPITGNKRVGPFASYADAYAAASSGAASGHYVATQFEGAGCYGCPPAPCLPQVYYSGGQIEWWVVLDIGTGEYWVILSFPSDTLAWVCCSPCEE